MTSRMSKSLSSGQINRLDKKQWIMGKDLMAPSSSHSTKLFRRCSKENCYSIHDNMYPLRPAHLTSHSLIVKSHRMSCDKLIKEKLAHSNSCDASQKLRTRWIDKYIKKDKKMLEVRRTNIIFPCKSLSLDLTIPVKTTTAGVLDMVADRCKLIDRKYFGLAFNNQNEHRQWLMSDRKVFEHDVIRDVQTPDLHFAVKFYTESYRTIKCPVALELMCLRCEELIFREEFECSDDVVFYVAGLVLQKNLGDLVDEVKVRGHISKMSLTPSFLLRRHPSLSYCEKEIIERYKRFSGFSKGACIANILAKVQQLPSYGTHFYQVKDKGGLRWWLGVSRKGLSIYDLHDKTTPRKLFEWRCIGNIFYRDKKFCFEIHKQPWSAGDESMFADVLKTSNNHVSNIEVHSWMCDSAQLTMSIWCMAVNQHQFFNETSFNKNNEKVKSREEVASLIDDSPFCLSSIHPSQHIVSTSPKESQLVADKAKEKMEELKKRRKLLDNLIEEKLKLLKEACLQEANLTGELPGEYPLKEGEEAPKVQRRVGTSYSIANNVNKQIISASNEVAKLYLEYELQDKITKAALTLAQDPSVSKKMRKGRLQDYQLKLQKLKWMEDDLKEKVLRSKQNKSSNKSEMRRSCESLNTKPVANLYPSYKRTTSSHNTPPKTKESKSSNDSSFKSAPSSPIFQKQPFPFHQRSQMKREDQREGRSNAKGYESDNNILDHKKSCNDNSLPHRHTKVPQKEAPRLVNKQPYRSNQQRSKQASPFLYTEHSTSTILPLSLDPRITRTNLAQSFGLLTINPHQHQHQQRLRQQYFNQQRLNHLFNNYHYDRHAQQRSSFSRSLAYPHLSCHDVVDSSGSSVSLSSSSTDPHLQLNNPQNNVYTSAKASSSSSDTHQSSPNLAPYHHNPFSNSPYNNNSFYSNNNNNNANINNGNTNNNNLPNNTNIESLISYNNNQNPLVKQQHLQHLARKSFNNTPPSHNTPSTNNTPPRKAKYPSNSQHSSITHSSSDGNYYSNNVPFNSRDNDRYNKNSNANHGNYNYRPKSAAKDSTLTRTNNPNAHAARNSHAAQNGSKFHSTTPNQLWQASTSMEEYNKRNKDILSWYESNGILPQPGDQYTLV